MERYHPHVHCRQGVGTDVELTRKQGFRKGKSTPEQIFVLRNIIVQVVKVIP